MKTKKIGESIKGVINLLTELEDEDIFAEHRLEEARRALEPMLTPYAAFTEDNDSEGESWTFFIPVLGNENALDNLRFFLDRYARELEASEEGGESPYSLTALGDEVLQYTVDVLLEQANDAGYMPRYNLLTGRLSSAKIEEGLGEMTGDNFLNALYKGRIRELIS